MSILVDGVQPQLARGMFELRGRIVTTLDDLFAAKGHGYHPSYDVSTSAWEFDFGAPGPVSEFLASECARFGCAAFQSYAGVEEGFSDPDRIPWALVRAYYAAFYAAHMLLRALGSSCTYIDGPRLAVIRKVVGLYGVSDPFVGGLYETSMSAAGAMRLENVGQGQGGTHEVFWRVFGGRLKTVEEAVLQGQLPTRDAQTVNLRLGRLRQTLSNEASDMSWLSTVRNAIQYRHAHDVWFPGCRVPSRERDVLGRIAASWRGDPIAIELPKADGGVLRAFLSASAFLVAACRCLILRIVERGRLGRKESFASFGPLQYLRNLGAGSC